MCSEVCTSQWPYCQKLKGRIFGPWNNFELVVKWQQKTERQLKLLNYIPRFILFQFLRLATCLKISKSNQQTLVNEIELNFCMRALRSFSVLRLLRVFSKSSISVLLYLWFQTIQIRDVCAVTSLQPKNIYWNMTGNSTSKTSAFLVFLNLFPFWLITLKKKRLEKFFTSLLNFFYRKLPNRHYTLQERF